MRTPGRPCPNQQARPCRSSGGRAGKQVLPVLRMAPGGVEPPHAASKAAALSTELRGRRRVSVAAPLTGPARLDGAGDEKRVADGTRTRDHRDHNPGLYQLSYRHHGAPHRSRVGSRGYAGRRNGGDRLSQAAGRRRRPAARRPRLRRAARRLVRRPGGHGRRDAVPRERDARPQRPARAARGGGAPLRALRRRQPDQPPEPRADRRARDRAARARHRPADRLRQPQLAPVPRRTRCASSRRRARAACWRSSPRRSARTRAAASTARTSTARRRPSAPARPRC